LLNKRFALVIQWSAAVIYSAEMRNENAKTWKLSAVPKKGKKGQIRKTQAHSPRKVR
jgi:hypothetical protein